MSDKKPAPSSRRNMLKGAVAAAGAGALAAPMIATAQTATTLRFQSTWPSKDIFHEYALDFAKKVNDMASGSICVALGWSGDVNIARQRAAEGKTGQNLQALIPKTGGLLFFDVMVIPTDAPRPGNAHKFINYVMRPEVHAALTNKAIRRRLFSIRSS